MAIGTTKVGAMSTNATTGPVTPAYPGTVAAGDAVIAVAVGRGTITAHTYSTGWTRIASIAQGTSLNLAVFVKDTRYNVGDATFSISMVGAVGVGSFTLAWAGARPAIMDFTASTPPTGSGTTTSMSAPTVTTRTANALVVNLYGSADDQAHGTAGGGSTAVASGASYISTAGNDFAMSAAVESISSPGSSGTNTMTHASGADNAYCSVTLALQPSVTVAGTASALLGALSAAVPAGHVDPTRGTSATSLGRLVGTATGMRTTFGTVARSLGVLNARATGIRTTFGSVAAPLGVLRGNVSGGHVTSLGGNDISLNPSVWVVDRPSQILIPIPNWTSLSLSPVRNQAGDVSVSYAVGAPAFDELHGAVSASPQTDCEIEIWLDGQGRGNARKRAILYQKSGDDLRPDNVWEFSGHFLEQLLAEVLVGIDNTETKETFFSGETPGTILATIFDRIKARSGLLLAGMTRDFTTTRDSNGQPWDEVLGTMKYTPDTTLLEVAQDLAGLATCEFEVTANRVFRVYNFDSRGTDHTVGSAPMRFQHGSNLREAGRRESSRVGEAATAVLGKGSEGAYAWATDATAEAQRGRRVESAQDVGRLTSTAAVLAGAEGRLFSLKTGVQERSHSIAFTPGSPIPLADFDVGDYAMSVTGDNDFQRMRIQQWKLVFDENGVTGDVVMNDLIQDWENLTEQRLNSIMRGSTVVGTSPSPPQVDDGKVPRAPFGVTANSAAYFDSSGATLAAVTMSWSPVTTNADGTALDDMAYYTPQFRYGTSSGLPTGWVSLPSVQHPSTTIDFGGVGPGVQADVRVAAVDRYSNVSAWSTAYSFTSASDAAAPPVPSTPTVQSYLGILRVIWDGKGSFGESMPADFDHVEIHVSTGENFVPDRPLVNGRLDERASTTYFDALFGGGDRPYSIGTYGVVYYARLVAVDRTGNYSTASLSGNAVLVQAGDGDIAELNVGKLRTGILTAVMTVSGTIRTALAGSRVELDSDGIRCFYGTRKVFDFSIPTGTMEMFGKLTAGLGIGAGRTVIVDPDEVSIRYYPDSTSQAYRSRAASLGLPLGGTGPAYEIAALAASGDYDGPQLLMFDDAIWMNPLSTGPPENFGTTNGPAMFMRASDYYVLIKTDYSVGSPITPADTHATALDLADGVANLLAHTAIQVIATVSNVYIQGGTNVSIRADNGSGNGGELYLLETGADRAQLWNGASFKSFVIDHPLDSKRYLVHVCTETPDARVEYSGIAEVVDGQAIVELPDYFEALTRTDGRRVQATCLLESKPAKRTVMKPHIDGPDEPVPGRPGLTMRRGNVTYHPVEVPESSLLARVAASLPVDGRFRIVSDQDGQVSWTVSAIRNDVSAFAVEPLKSDVDVHGDGPYRYLTPRPRDV